VEWGKADRFACQDFPRLFEEDLLRITLGVYQGNLVGEYTKEHLDDQSMKFDGILVKGLCEIFGS